MLALNKLHNMDCMDGMRVIPDKIFELAIVDPPYGIGEDGSKAKRGVSMLNSKTRQKVNLGHTQKVINLSPGAISPHQTMTIFESFSAYQKTKSYSAQITL